MLEPSNRCYGCGQDPCASPGKCADELMRMMQEDRASMKGMIGIWNQAKLVNTPLTQITTPTNMIYVNGDEGSFTFTMPYTISTSLIDFASDPDMDLATREIERMREEEMDRDDVAFLLRTIPMSREKAEKAVKKYKEWKKTQVHLDSQEVTSQ